MCVRLMIRARFMILVRVICLLICVCKCTQVPLPILRPVSLFKLICGLVTLPATAGTDTTRQLCCLRSSMAPQTTT